MFNTRDMPNPPMLRTAEVAAELKIHRSTLTRMVKAGKITPAVRGEGIRGEMWFKPAEVRRAQKRMQSERAA